MKKNLLTILLLVAAYNPSYCQKTATDFTANDCNSNSHSFFNELDNGKVIVLAWIMPCLTCTGPVKTAYNISKAYSNKPEYAGRVKFYLIDDYGNNDCTYLSNWASNNNVGPDILTVFDNAPGGTVINEDDYGGMGMPHICIVGGNDHRVYFNGFNWEADDPGGIENALFSALIPTSVGNTNTQSASSTLIYPNPAGNTVNVQYMAAGNDAVVISLMNVVGETVYQKTVEAGRGMNTETVDMTELGNGVYFLQLRSRNTAETYKFNKVN